MTSKRSSPDAAPVGGGIDKVGDLMTANPYTIGMEESLSKAYSLMREHNVRHLPVVDGEEVVGIVSRGDVDLVHALRSVELSRVTVHEAMTPDPYCVFASVPLHEVAAEMAAKRLGSAIILDEGRKVIGIFTAVDGLRLLGHLLLADSR